MPSTISVNFTTREEVLGTNPPTVKVVSASVLRSVLDTGGGGSGYVTVAGTQTITGAKTFSAAIAGTSSNFSSTVTAGTGANGYARLNNGSATNPGYLAWFTPDNIRRGYVGWQSGSTENINFLLENGWGLNINSPSKPVVITGDLTVTGNTTGIIPVGAVMGFFTSTAPAGWLHLNGAADLSRNLYPNLWAHALASGNIVTQAAWDAGKFGSFHRGDGTTTFGIPWTLGAFLRGWSSSGGIDSGRVIGSYQADGIKDHSHSGTTGNQSANHTHTVTSAASRFGANGTGPNAFYGSMGDVGNSNRRSLTSSGVSTNHSHSFSSTNALVGATPDTRPPNVPILYCIKF